MANVTFILPLYDTINTLGDSVKVPIKSQRLPNDYPTRKVFWIPIPHLFLLFS